LPQVLFRLFADCVFWNSYLCVPLSVKQYCLLTCLP
jgi:hypothetical protein